MGQTRYLTHGGETKSIKQWAADLGLNVSTIRVRLHKGDSVERALRKGTRRIFRPPERFDDRIEIPLTQGYRAVVDLDCPEWILAMSWQPKRVGPAVYAVNSSRHKLHRAVMGLASGDPRLVDHVDRDTLNDRRGNLRICTQQQNLANRVGNHVATSRYRGVSWDKDREKWKANVAWRDDQKKRRMQFLGRFDDEIEAAHAYDAAARQVFDPEFFRPNFPVVLTR